MKLSNYQDPEGTAKDWKPLAPRTNDVRYKDLSWMDICRKRTVLDLGCNNGFFTREAMRRGAQKAVGVDIGECVEGARELAREEGVDAEFWRADIDSKEFRRHCPQFEVVLVLSVLTHMRDKDEFLDWLDSIATYAVVFESNHGERNKAHIELLKKHMWFESVEYLGPQDVPEKPHYLWVCRKHNHHLRYPEILKMPIEFMEIDRITGWDEETIFNQKTKYGVDTPEFQNLLQDIKERGIREPIVVEDEQFNYKGFQGAHRYLAAKYLGYTSVPVRVLRGQRYLHLHKELK